MSRPSVMPVCIGMARGRSPSSRYTVPSRAAVRGAALRCATLSRPLRRAKAGRRVGDGEYRVSLRDPDIDVCRHAGHQGLVGVVDADDHAVGDNILLRRRIEASPPDAGIEGAIGKGIDSELHRLADRDSADVGLGEVPFADTVWVASPNFTGSVRYLPSAAPCAVRCQATTPSPIVPAATRSHSVCLRVSCRRQPARSRAGFR